MVQERIKNCIPCQAATQGRYRATTRGTGNDLILLPKAPWNVIAIVFVGPFPLGDVLLVVIDKLSRFPEVEIRYSTTATPLTQKTTLFSLNQSRQIEQINIYNI